MKTIQSINNGTLADILEAAVSERDKVSAWAVQRQREGDMDLPRITHALTLAGRQVVHLRQEVRRRFPGVKIPNGVCSSNLATYVRKWPDKIGME